MLVPSRRVGFVLATAARLVPCRALGGGAAAHHGAALGSEARPATRICETNAHSAVIDETRSRVI